jgi:amino acid adenylation domain-containing protein
MLNSQTNLHLSIASAEGQWHIRLDWNETSICPIIATNLFHSVNEALVFMATSISQPLELVNICSPHHHTQIAQFTKHVSAFNNTLLHDMCLQHAKTTPDAPAVVSWDGDLTYAELDDLTSRLAHQLAQQGVRRGTFVVSCFAKSTWAIVSRLAILKAGGAYISIDARDPPAYLESIIRRASVGIMLTSPEYTERFRNLVDHAVEITHTFLNALPVKTEPACADIRPEDPCLILFTSGSTGTPKGIIQEHRSYATSITDYIQKIGLDASSRVFQFDDYAFDISNNDYLATLAAGGVCCVPTAVTPIAALRDNINALQANMSFLTPTVIAQLKPAEVPTLRTICMGGEPPSPDIIAQWAGTPGVRLINQYGMGEAATFCALNDNPDSSRPNIIGRTGCGAIWLMNPADTEQLVPVGAVGEILIEGPHLARGYLDGVAVRADVGFLPRAPAWMGVIHGEDRARTNRVYRSGDLGRYRANGTVEYLGRKDAMLKLNGYRVNAVEVECVLRRCLVSESDSVVVDILGRMREDEEPALSAFVYVAGAILERGEQVGDICIQTVSVDDAIYPLVQRMQDLVAGSLPTHMMPSAFLQVDRVPRTKSNKTDRRRLHMYGQEFYVNAIRP